MNHFISWLRNKFYSCIYGEQRYTRLENDNDNESRFIDSGFELNDDSDHECDDGVEDGNSDSHCTYSLYTENAEYTDPIPISDSESDSDSELSPI